MINVYEQFELTLGNHLQYWFNDNRGQHWRNDPLEVAHCCVGENYINAQSKTFNQSITDTANVFYSRHGSDFLLFLSGGLDSEVALQTFINAKNTVKPFIIRFTNELNKEDVSDALRLCNTNGIEPIIYEFDPLQFFHSGEWKRVAETYQCYTFYQQMLIYIAERTRKPMITVDEVEVAKLSDKWYFVKKEDQDGCWHRFVERTSCPAYNNFYTYDPATILAFIQSPTVQNLINDKIPGKLGWNSSKHKIYTELTDFDLIPRNKRHGMERLMHIWWYVLEHTARILHNSPVDFKFEATSIIPQLSTGKGLICNSL